MLFQGCEMQLHNWLQENILTIVGMDFGLMLIQVKNNKTGSCHSTKEDTAAL